MRNIATNPYGNGGSGRQGIFKDMGKEHSFFKFKESANRIAIVPFTVTSKNHPLVHAGHLKEGDQFYCLDVYVHRFVGANGSDYVCLRRNYGKKCPICDAAQKYIDNEGKDSPSAKELFASRRIYFNVVDLQDIDAGIQILDVSNKGFLEPLMAAQIVADTDPDIQDVQPDAFFAYLDNGLTVKVAGVKDSFNGKEFIRASSISLAARRKNEDITGFAKDAIPFDAHLVVMDYEDMEAHFNGEAIETENAPQFQREEAPKQVAPKQEAPKVDDEPPKCPSGHNFGDAFRKDMKECDDCDLWKTCVKHGRKLDDIPF